MSNTRRPVVGSYDVAFPGVYSLISLCPTLIVITPVCFLMPLATKALGSAVCVERLEDLPTLTTNSFAVLDLICNHLPLG